MRGRTDEAGELGKERDKEGGEGVEGIVCVFIGIFAKIHFVSCPIFRNLWVVIGAQPYTKQASFQLCFFCHVKMT